MIINITAVELKIVLQLCFSSFLPFSSPTYPTHKAHVMMTANTQPNASITKGGKESVHTIRAALAYAELSGRFT